MVAKKAVSAIVRRTSLAGAAYSAMVLMAAVASCATSPSQNPKSTAHCANIPCWIQITPLSSLKTGFSDPDENFSNLYTRVMVNSRGTRNRENTEVKDNSSDLTELYEYNDRGAFPRTFWGTHYSINLTAYVTVGNYLATVPLVTIDHTSNRSDGEKFLRTIAHTVQNFPLILIKGDGSNAAATVRFVVKASDETQSRVAALAIQAAESVAKAISPESAVVTTLSAQSAKDKATALDSAINSLMSKQLDEEQLIDNDVRRWSSGAELTFRVPPPNNEAEWGDSDHFKAVGYWTVTFEDPRPSVFSDIQLCYAHHQGAMPGEYCRPTVAAAIDAAQKDAANRPEQVLAFNLLNGTQSLGTVSAYLKQQSWWETSMKTFNGLKKTETPQTDDVSSFCRSIKDSIASIGLNAVDSGIVVAAVRDRAQLGSPVSTAMKTTEECKYAASP
jgi:hypothetical protein